MCRFSNLVINYHDIFSCGDSVIFLRSRPWFGDEARPLFPLIKSDAKLSCPYIMPFSLQTALQKSSTQSSRRLKSSKKVLAIILNLRAMIIYRSKSRHGNSHGITKYVYQARWAYWRDCNIDTDDIILVSSEDGIAKDTGIYDTRQQ